MNKKNRIIVLTDFSEYSENLTTFAFSISEVINAKVVFVHEISGLVPAMADREVRDEMLKFETDEAYSKLRRLAQGRVHSADSFIVSEKPVLAMLQEIAADHYFDWVFTGLKGTGVMKQMFIGSTPISIVNESNFLMVAVPFRTQIMVPNKLMVAVNPEYPLNEYQLNMVLLGLKDQIKELEFFTILKENEDEIKAKDYLLNFQKEYKEHHPEINLYKGSNNTIDIIKQRVELNKNAFLVLQQGPRSLSDKFFRKFMINEMVYNGQFPFIVLSR